MLRIQNKQWIVNIIKMYTLSLPDLGGVRLWKLLLRDEGRMLVVTVWVKARQTRPRKHWETWSKSYDDLWLIQPVQLKISCLQFVSMSDRLIICTRQSKGALLQADYRWDQSASRANKAATASSLRKLEHPIRLLLIIANLIVWYYNI